MHIICDIIWVRFNNVVFSLVRLNAAVYANVYNNNIYYSHGINTCATFAARINLILLYYYTHTGIIGGLYSLYSTRYNFKFI